jgi:hypothetical protein
MNLQFYSKKLNIFLIHNAIQKCLYLDIASLFTVLTSVRVFGTSEMLLSRCVCVVLRKILLLEYTIFLI